MPDKEKGKKVRMGCTRIVFIGNKYVYKVPNFTYSWQNFLKGLLANIQESTTYKWHSERHLLCPVKWCSWGGWLLIMDKADTKNISKIFKDSTGDMMRVKEKRERLFKRWIDAGLGGDDKPDNYGILNGRTVKIDYGQ